MSEDQLLDDIKSSIMDMQTQMQDTYSNLNDLKISGNSSDKTVSVTMTATYSFVDLDFNERALQGGVKEFKRRINEAWDDVTKSIQKTTQEKTVELLQSMYVPDDIKNIDMNAAQGQLPPGQMAENDPLKDFAADLHQTEEDKG